MKKETMYDLGRILLLAGVVLLIFSIILCISSAAFVSKVGDAIGQISYMDIDMDGDLIKSILGMAKDSYKEEFGRGIGTAAMLREMGVGAGGVGFGVFALYAKGWFWLITILDLIVSIVFMMLAKDSKLVPMSVEYGRRIGKAFVKAFKGLFVFASTGKPRAPRARYNCPNCGAPLSGNAPFCAQCGMRLPDMASIGVCKKCGTRNDPNANFCAGCGAPMR